MRTTRTPASCAVSFKARPTSTGSRLSSKASRPQGPGCSTRSQFRTWEAVPCSGSSRASASSAQRNVSLVKDDLEEPLTDESLNENESPGFVEPGAELVEPESVASGHEAHRVRHMSGHVELTVSKEDAQSIAGGLGDANGPGSSSQKAAVVQLA